MTFIRRPERQSPILPDVAAEHQVAVVVDPDYGENLRELAMRIHVWVVRSPVNNPVVNALWAASQGSYYSPESGVSAFTGNATAEESFLGVLGVVEEHHGPYSHDPPLSVIEVIGTEPSDAVRERLATYGFDEIASKTDGFIARRTR